MRNWRGWTVIAARRYVDRNNIAVFFVFFHGGHIIGTKKRNTALEYLRNKVGLSVVMNNSKNTTKTGFRAWVIALLTFLIAIPVLAVDFSSAEKVKLKMGKTVVKMLPTSGQKGFYGGSGYALIDAPVDEVWNILLDFELYTRMFPNTEVCTAISRKGNKTLIKMKIGHPVVNVRYHVETTANEAEKSLHFQLLNDYPHDIDSLTGYWRLFPQAGNRTLAAYVVSVKAPPGIVAIAGDDLANRAVVALLKIPGNIKRWVERSKTQKSDKK